MAIAEKAQTKPGGLIARLFPSNPQPTPADVEQQIADVERQRADLQVQLAIIEGEIAESWGLDTASLEAQVISLTAKIAAAGQVLGRLQTEKIAALTREATARIEQFFEDETAIPKQIAALETPETLARWKQTEDERAESDRLRAQSRGNAISRLDRVNQIVNAYPEEIRGAIRAHVRAVEQNHAETLNKNYVTLAEKESAFWKGRQP